MGQLREVSLALERKKQAAKRKASIGDDYEAKALATLNDLVGGLKAPVVAPDRFESVAKQLAKGITGLGKGIGELKAMEVGFDPIFVRFDAIESHMDSLIGALNGIEIPTPEMPAVNVAAPDLEPLMHEVALLRQDIASIQINVEAQSAPSMDTPRHVIFDIERTQGGYLKRVVAKAQ